MDNFKKIIKDFITYNKKLVFFIITFLLILIISLIAIFSTIKNEEKNDPPIEIDTVDTVSKIVLFGSKEITLNQGDTYQEPGFYAISKNGELKTESVIVANEVDTSKPGTYIISYVADNEIEKRTVIVKEKKIDQKLDLTLKGESLIVLEIGDTYQEPGFIAYDTVDKDITDQVKINSSLNTNEAGTYKIIYEVTNSNGDSVKASRTVVVNQGNLEVSLTTNASTNYQNKNVIVNILVTGNNFSYVKYPDNTISKNKNSNYEISTNGLYKFYIYDKNYNYVVKEININNIDKNAPSASCTTTVYNGKSIFNVIATDNLSGIKKYDYYGNGSLLTSSNSKKYTAYKEVSSSYVIVYDNALNQKKVNCTISTITNVDPPVDPTPPDDPSVKNDFLEMHFIISGHNDDAILIRSGLGTILIDGGRYDNYKKVVPYLENLGVKTIDAIIGSHPHYNHIQMQAKVIENFNVKSAYYSVDLNTCASKNYCDSKDVLYIKDALKKYNIPTFVKYAGDIITIKDMTIYILGPYKLNNTSTYKQNANSFLFILKYKNNTFMFTGDADSGTFNLSKVKPYADKFGISLDVDMLKYPHHGNSTVPTDLLKAMSPKYVIIPNYSYSKYPTSSNLTKLKNVGATVYKNSSDGNIVLISDGNKITVKKNQSASSYKR